MAHYYVVQLKAMQYCMSNVIEKLKEKSIPQNNMIWQTQKRIEEFHTWPLMSQRDLLEDFQGSSPPSHFPYQWCFDITCTVCHRKALELNSSPKEEKGLTVATRRVLSIRTEILNCYIASAHRVLFWCGFKSSPVI